MLGKISKWGNSHGVRLPKDVLSRAGISQTDCVEITAVGKKIVISKVETEPSLENLFRGYDMSRYTAKELDWGSPAGKEVW